MPLIQQPANRITLTNISLVRLKKGKKRFEIACYKNKLLEYRSGLETDLDNVLQVPTIFLSVSKGLTAPTADLQKSFGKGVSTDDMIAEILKKGELQVGSGERKELLDRLEREVVELVSERVVDPETKRVYTTGMITKALDLLSKQAGHTQQGLETSKDLTEDNDDVGGGGNNDEQAGYMGLGRLDINDEEENQRQNQKSTSKKSSKPKGHKSTSKPPQLSPEEETAAPGPDTSKEQSHPTVPTWTGVSTTKSPKALALEAMKALIYWQPIPVQRARMRLRISIASNILKQTVKAPNKPMDDSHTTTSPSEKSSTTPPRTVKDYVLSQIEQIESQDYTGTGEDWEVTGYVEPGAYKGLNEFIGTETRGRGRVEVLDMAVHHED